MSRTCWEHSSERGEHNKDEAFTTVSLSTRCTLPTWANIGLRCLSRAAWVTRSKRNWPLVRTVDDLPDPLIRRIRLVVTPPAERNELIEVEVGAPLRALDHMMDIEAAPHATGLA